MLDKQSHFEYDKMNRGEENYGTYQMLLMWAHDLRQGDEMP